jgi:hypothetical protein
MTAPQPAATATTVVAAPSIPAQRTSDAFTAYASVHQLGAALHRAHDAGADAEPDTGTDPGDLRP